MISANQIHRVIGNRYNRKNHTQSAYIREVSLGCGFHNEPENRAMFQGQIDGIIVDGTDKGHGPELTAVEIKTTSRDLRREVKRPDKRRGFVDRCNRFYFATAPGVGECADIPDDCGWLIVDVKPPGKTSRIYVAKAAPYTAALLDVSFVAALVRKAKGCK